MTLAENKPKILTVSELTRKVRVLLEEGFAEVWVSGEVSNFRSPSSGHFYFTLKDEVSQLTAVLFRGVSGKLPFKMEDGLELICHGRLSVYEPRGNYQIIVDHCEPKGMGALALAFEQLKKKLESEGLFRKEHKKPIPFLPKKVGIVTSDTGAAIRDILKILHQRFPVEVLLVPVRVQGEGAALEIANAIDQLQKTDCDVMIVGRGGGSLEDLWAFNEEVVARAIFRSKIPVISAVGHEIDFTIADFVADLRAPTPTAAAQMVVPSKEDLEKMIADLRARLNREVRNLVPDFWMEVDALKERLQNAERNIFIQKEQRFHQLLAELEAHSPLGVLTKGYSVIRKIGKKESIRSSKELQTGDWIEMIFSKGRSIARVEPQKTAKKGKKTEKTAQKSQNLRLF